MDGGFGIIALFVLWSTLPKNNLRKEFSLGTSFLTLLYLITALRHSTLSVDHKFVIFEKEWYKLPESDDDLLSDAVLSQEAFVKQ